MRETRNAQVSIFDFYAPHALGNQLSLLSELLDEHPLILDRVERNFRVPDTAATGANGLSVESVFRCLLLKQILMSQLFKANTLTLDWLRIDSTVTDSNIATPSDSQLLNDGVRVLSRLMNQSKDITGVKIRFTDQRKKSKSLSYRIFHAKKVEKDALYPELLSYATLVMKQSRSAIDKVRLNAKNAENAQRWIDKVEHFMALLPIVIDQTQRRVFNDEDVPASQKIVSLFEPHTDLIVKGLRDVQFGHKINLATQQDGFITYCRIEEGNPADAVLYMPVLNASPYAPDGRCISLLKILLTNFCTYDCLYCVNRVSSNVARARFSIDEVVYLTLSFYKRNYIEGLFLSSGTLQSPDYTMEQIVEVARRLRVQHDFRGYIHLKTIPEASPDLLSAAGLYADRLSINVELARNASLAQLAPQKDATGIKRSMAAIRARCDGAVDNSVSGRKPEKFASAGQSTQMIVGADDAVDHELLQCSSTLYSSYKLKRVYYSAFSPIPDASASLLLKATDLMREHRLIRRSG